MNRRIRRLGHAVFGDRCGVVLFLATLSVYAVYWRIGIVITDSYTVANALVAVADGHLYLDDAVYGAGLETPGTGTVDGRLYGRNYGQVFLAVPFLLFVEAMAAVADLRVALAAVWALLVVGLARLVGRELDRPKYAAYVGSALALTGFAAAIAGTTTIDADRHYLIALQMQTMVAAALVGVVCYRLLARVYDRRIGFAGGVAASLATPVGFWAQFPKRHVLVTLCVVASMYLLYRSREGDAVDVRFRAAAYVPVGVAAWVSAAEGVILLLALLAVDVPTAGRDLRSLVTAGATCVVSVVPMFVTNYLISGNAAQPPRVLSAGGDGSLAGDNSGSSSGTEATPQSSGTEATPQPGSETLDTFIGATEVVLRLFDSGIETLVGESGRLYHTFVRGGYIADVAARDAGEAIRLAFLEAMPLAAALLAVPIIAVRTDFGARLRSALENRRLSALGTVDAFVAVYATALTLVYLPRLPLHATITVRYLLALFPIAVYALVRMGSVRRVLAERLYLAVFTYASGVLIGGQLLVVYLWVVDATRGEAVQTHALVGLGTAALLAGWTLFDTTGRRADRFGAVALGLAAASGTVFLLLAGLWHFAFVGGRALPFG
ncbi:hypothetical protein [Natronomonas gomsonensis]|uniref:hypothetical protein n=1 Tax=Natronomonas gomsonensis TaxID=1046043 RepID=UPI0015BDC3B6|nr:hypothetical protein [Natronomonas gomsonensis]